MCLWARGSCCASRLAAPGKVVLVQAYCVNPPPGPPPPSNVPAPAEKSAAQVVKKRVLAVLGVKQWLHSAVYNLINHCFTSGCH